MDLKTNILASAGLLKEGIDVETQFEQISAKVVDMETGRYSNAVDPATYDQRKASSDPALSVALESSEDLAKIKRRVNYATVYILEGAEGLEKVILPIKGYGLWSTMYGFIALEKDLQTVAGIGFYEHGETPGLGGEIDNPNWKSSWIGKQAFAEDELVLTVIKGKVDMNRAAPIIKLMDYWRYPNHQGVDNLVQYWLGDQGFGALY